MASKSLMHSQHLKNSISCSFFILCLAVLGLSTAMAGITGTLSGTIVDKESGTVLRGADIVVEGTTLGAQADKNGYFKIFNLPAGHYDVSARMIGYARVTITQVRINIDLDTKLNFKLSAEVLPLEEVVITDSKRLIQGAITSSTYFVSGNQIYDELPIESYRDAIGLLPGVVGNHVRGGRDTDVLYLLDGLPIQGALSREISSYFPNSSIVEMMVQTGGFSAEYGHAGSGIVNVISKEGRNKVEGNLKFYTDFIGTEFAESDKMRRLEFNVGGPMTIGFGGPLVNAKYFISADLNLSDTPARKKLDDAFGSPIFSNYNINSKLSFDIARNTILSLQGLLSNWKWHEFDPQWELNPAGLAESKHYSHRLSASLTHTFSPKYFATLRVAHYSTERSIDGEIETEPPELLFEDATDPRSRILSGNQPWEEKTTEDVDIVKFDVVGSVAPHHLLKAGIDYQNYKLGSQNIQYVALPSKTIGGAIAFNRTQNNFEYTPTFTSLYLLDQIRFKGITANLGLRFDVFDPDINIEEVPQAFKKVQVRLNAPAIGSNSATHNTVSPRLGLSLPLSESERVHVNYGWYYQMPPLYYMTTNADRRLDSYLPIIGNTEIEPIKTVATEISYKRIVSDDWLFVITGFVKQFENLIDTQTFVLADSLIGDDLTNIGYSQYVNSASGDASGFEITVQKKFTPELSARVSYTYMKARGTSSFAEEEFNNIAFGSPSGEGSEFPLSWDQRHSIIVDASYETRAFRTSLLYRLFSPLPVTTPDSETPNDKRMSWRNILDIRIKMNSTNLLGGHMKPFFEIRNLFDENNVVAAPNKLGVRAYKLFDPINANQGRRLRLGIILDF